MNNKIMHEYLGGGQILDCNCHSGDSNLVARNDDKFQVLCDGCGMRGPAGSKASAVHEWNLITMAAASSFNAAQLISLWSIEKCREQGKCDYELRFVETLQMSMEGSETDKATLLKKMGIAPCQK